MHYHGRDIESLECRQFRARLDLVLDERLRPERDPELRAHARRCSNCAGWMKAQTRALAALESMADAECPADLAFRVVQSHEPDRRRPLHWRRWTIASLAIAAGLLLAILSWRSPEANRPETPLAKQSPPVPPYELLARETQDFAFNLKAHQLVVVGEVAEGFKPVTSSVFSALNTLWRALPGSESATRTL